MIWLFLALSIYIILAGFYRFRLVFLSSGIIIIHILFYYFSFTTLIEFLLALIPSCIFLALLNLKKLRQNFISKNLYSYLQQANNNWKSFQRIDNGWFASGFEKSIFQGKPEFLQLNFKKPNTNNHEELTKNIQTILLSNTKRSSISSLSKLAKIGATSLIIEKKHGGQNMSTLEISELIKNTSRINPLYASIIGLMNLDSLTSLITHFASFKQRNQFLPLIANAKMTPFLKPTSLYENLESQKSSIEGRIEKNLFKNKQVLGVRLSFQDIILLGGSQSNCFFINVNIKDFNNVYGDITHLGTAICIINKDITGIEFKKGLKAYEDCLYYFACTGEKIFVPFSHIINEETGIGKGLEYLYKNQSIASSIWPLAVSIPTINTATLTSWYFAHLQKQNGRQLLSYKVVIAKLNEQFSQCLKFQLLDHISLFNNIRPGLLKFTAILNKNTHIKQTMEQLGLLREILGSNSHNIKTESRVRSFYKVAHITTELDGMSHEINQLPLIKKAALACHPYYDHEIKILSNNNSKDIETFDRLIFQHIGYIIHNLIKIWMYSIKSSFFARILFPKNKYKSMIKRMSASFAFLSDITLINWTFKTRINTSFASQLGQCIQHITASIAILDFYQSDQINNNSENNTNNKYLAKSTLKNSLYFSQTALNQTVKLAFNRPAGIIIKILLFPLGKPFHKNTVFNPLHNDIESICNLNKDNQNPYAQHSPFLEKISLTKKKLKEAESAENAVTNATGMPLTTDNYETLINRCLAAGIVSVEQSEQLRDAYQSILDIQLTNHFGKNHHKKNEI